MSNGPHRLAALLTDAGGNTASVGPFQVDVENPTIRPAPGVPMIPVPAQSAVLVGRLTASLGPHRVTKLTVGYAAPPVIRGRVTRSGGKPLAGADVQWAVEAARAPTGFVAQRAVPTDDSGRFSIRLPRGPSRTVRLSYGSSTVTLRVEVRAPVRLGVDHRATRNGRRIRFTGSVLGAPATARTLIELQAWAGRWTTFETALLKQGRFSASYRFTRTFATTRYRFRAVLRADSQLPYATGWSPQVSVLVRR